MYIVRRSWDGETTTIRFYCKNCGCIFDANSDEFVFADRVASSPDAVLAQCECPMCKNTAYHCNDDS